jgi:hypothetical protein
MSSPYGEFLFLLLLPVLALLLLEEPYDRCCFSALAVRARLFSSEDLPKVFTWENKN